MNAYSVLIVEDNPVTRKVLIQVVENEAKLKFLGSASSYGEAMESLASKPDILLVDIGLPDGSGIDLIRLAKEQEYLTFDDLNEALPDTETDLELMEELIERLQGMKFRIIDSAEVNALSGLSNDLHIVPGDASIGSSVNQSSPVIGYSPIVVDLVT